MPIAKLAKMLCFAGILCFFCKSILQIDKRPSIVTVYTSTGSFQCQHFVKKCGTKACRSHYHYSYFTKFHVNYHRNLLAKFYYDDSLKKEYFLCSSSTAFQTEFLKSFYSNMFLCPEYSLHQKAMEYNINVPTGNAIMDPKCLREAFYQLALMDMLQLFYSGKQLSSLIQSHDVDKNIIDILPSLKVSFRQYYSKHRCNVPGCGVVMGFDADCKVSIE